MPPLYETGNGRDIERREIEALKLKLELEQYTTERGLSGSLSVL